MKADPPATSPCELCRRQVAQITRHHLIPRARHRTRRNQRLFERQEVKQRIALLCSACHRQIHVLLDEKELEQTFNTIELLRSHPEVARFVRWIRNKPDGKKIVSRRVGETRRVRRRR